MDMPLGVEAAQDEERDVLLDLTADVVAAFVSNNSLSTSDLPRLISDTHSALKGLSGGTMVDALPARGPAVPIKNSVGPDYIVCLDDGKKFKSLKRHIATLGMTPDQYRAKWGLPRDYPMVAPNYSATRSALAKKSGLGRKLSAAQAKAGVKKANAKTRT